VAEGTGWMVNVEVKVRGGRGVKEKKDLNRSEGCEWRRRADERDRISWKGKERKKKKNVGREEEEEEEEE